MSKLLLLLMTSVTLVASSGRRGCDWARIPACVEGVSPTRVGNCPSCNPLKPLGEQCSKEAIRSCRGAPACAEGEAPTRVGCCPSCKPAKYQCPAGAKEACRAAMSEPDFPVCTGNEEHGERWDKTTCCPTCKRPPRREPRQECSKDDFKQCVVSGTTPVCAIGEEPEREEGQCCKTCVRDQALQPLRSIAKCAEVPDCEAGERPARVEGPGGSFSCHTCRPRRPECGGGCSKGQLCTRGKGREMCVNKRAKKLKVRARHAAAKAFVDGATEEEIRAMLVEIVGRFCDNPDNADLCDTHMDTLVDGIIVRVTGKEGGETEVEVDVPSTTPGRRLLAVGSASDLLSAALDDNQDSDIQFDDGSSSSASRLYSSIGLAVSVATAASLLL